MRVFILLITVLLLPLMIMAHGWFFTVYQKPFLQQEAHQILVQNGILNPGIDLQFLDLHISGHARDLATLERIREALKALSPLRVVEEKLGVPAHVTGKVVDGDLLLEGWLPDDKTVLQTAQVLVGLRPDLRVVTTHLQADTLVQMPPGEPAEIHPQSGLLRPLIQNLRLASALEMWRDSQDVVHAKGALPATGVRPALLALLPKAQADSLKEIPLAKETDFAKTAALLPFVKSFFAAAGPRKLSFREGERPHLVAMATVTQVAEWRPLLLKLSENFNPEMEITYYPSEFHFPGRPVRSPIPADLAPHLVSVFRRELITFSPDSSSLSPENQARLASLAPSLLSAGPAVSLVIGGHPDPTGNPVAERALALQRAAQVHAFLVEQGLPATDVTLVAFDSVLAGTPGAPVQTGCVELLLR